MVPYTEYYTTFNNEYVNERIDSLRETHRRASQMSYEGKTLLDVCDHIYKLLDGSNGIRLIDYLKQNSIGAIHYLQEKRRKHDLVKLLEENPIKERIY